MMTHPHHTRSEPKASGVLFIPYHPYYTYGCTSTA